MKFEYPPINEQKQVLLSHSHAVACAALNFQQRDQSTRTRPGLHDQTCQRTVFAHPSNLNHDCSVNLLKGSLTLGLDANDRGCPVIFNSIRSTNEFVRRARGHLLPLDFAIGWVFLRSCENSRLQCQRRKCLDSRDRSDRQVSADDLGLDNADASGCDRDWCLYPALTDGRRTMSPLLASWGMA